MNNGISRRLFLGGAVASTVASAADLPGGKALPTRTLGRTGATPTILALGCGSRLLSYETAERGAETVEMALDAGVRYLDTAQAYGNGRSESWVGEVMQTRREGVFLATKTQARSYDDILSRMDESLKRLRTDQVDLLHLHSLQGPDDVETFEKERGLEALYRIRDEKMARFIGITSHTDPEALAMALERFDVDCTQMALNAALQGMQSGKGKMIVNPAMPTSFEEVALPVARKKNIGVIAMKVFGQEDLVPDAHDQEHATRLLRYSLSLPGVAVAVVGCPRHEYLKANAATAAGFEPMPEAERERFSAEMAKQYKAGLDRKFRRHADV